MFRKIQAIPWQGLSDKNPAKSVRPHLRPSFPRSFRKHQGSLKNTKDFSHRANPQKPCKTSRNFSKNTQEDQAISGEEKQQGNKNTKEKKDREFSWHQRNGPFICTTVVGLRLRRAKPCFSKPRFSREFLHPLRCAPRTHSGSKTA